MISPTGPRRGTPAPERTRFARSLVLAGALIVAALLPRLLVYPVNENLYGDAIPRTELAERWARAPHVITAFGDGAAQFGPLHLYLVAGALQFIDREDAARFVSLVFGALTVLPLFLLARRLVDERAARWAAFGFSVWGMHIQTSTTGGSEALALFLMIGTLALFARGLDGRRLWPFAASGLVLTLAAAVRYDAWMYIPLLALVPMVQWGSPGRGLRAGSLFALCALLFPAAWLVGNHLAHGDAFYPFTYIDAFHREWAAGHGDGLGRLWLRAQGIGFWPAMAIFTLSPGVAAFAAVGMVRVWRERKDVRWLIVIALVPIGYYGIRTAVLVNFVPLARFGVVPLALLLPFVSTGIDAAAERWGMGTARRLVWTSTAIAVLLPAALGAFTFRSDGTIEEVLRPLSPTSTNSRAIAAVARFIGAEARDRGASIALDMDRNFQDLQVGFFSRLTEPQLVRLRWPGFQERIARNVPDLVVRFDNGTLTAEAGVELQGRTLVVDRTPYVEIDGFDPPVHVYRRQLSLPRGR